MKKVLLTLVLILVSVVSNCQINNAIMYFQKGTEAFNANKFDEAVLLLTTSIEKFPTSDAYFNRGVTYFNLGDTCRFCKDMLDAAKLEDTQAKNMYEEKCMFTTFCYNIPDSMKLNYPGLVHYEVIHHKYLIDSIVSYGFKNADTTWNVKESNLYFMHKDTPPICKNVEVMPEFPGGVNEMMKFIFTNLHYPKDARDHGKSGVVLVSFIISTDGSMIYPKVIKGFDKSCEVEALRVINLFPKWIPGKSKGKAVAVNFNLPISFKLGYSKVR